MSYKVKLKKCEFVKKYIFSSIITFTEYKTKSKYTKTYKAKQNVFISYVQVLPFISGVSQSFRRDVPKQAHIMSNVSKPSRYCHIKGGWYSLK